VVYDRDAGTNPAAGGGRRREDRRERMTPEEVKKSAVEAIELARECRGAETIRVVEDFAKTAIEYAEEGELDEARAVLDQAWYYAEEED
jgi:isopropylmalate/homocitrate/citramalate synthase